MQNLLEQSRRISNPNESPIKLTHLSPQKYGKGAFCDLSYTPSKIADNVLYRQVATLKKMEQGNGRLRESQALTALLQDRLDQLREERDGIQKSLTSQITMYKKLLHECQNRNEAHLRQIQKNFKLQIQKLILQKQQQAKYSQSQKQLLENRINDLQNLLSELQQKHNDQVKAHNQLRIQKQKVDIQHTHSKINLDNLQSQRKIQTEKAKNQFQQLSQKLIMTTNQHSKHIEDTVMNKNKQIQNLQKFHRTQLQKIDNKRTSELLIKNQQLKNLTTAFQSQGKRLNQVINMKQRTIETLTKDLAKQKQRVLQLTRTYQNQLNNIKNQNARLAEQLEVISRENTSLNLKLIQNQNLYQKQKIQLQNCIKSFKDELELNQANFVRQQDRNGFIAGDLQKQIIALKSENITLRNLNSENQILNHQIRKLRELLVQSSNQMERCKEEFLRMERQREILLLKLGDLGCQNEVLHHINCTREEEASRWKQSYYIPRNRY